MISSFLRPLRWVGSAKKDLGEMPVEVQAAFGYALHLVQIGSKHDQAKPLKGFGGAGVLEIVEDCQGDTYRAIYTVRCVEELYVLHCFQKKSVSGSATPKPDMDLIRTRLKTVIAMQRSRE
ncbi:addiction module toxin RelE [Collimonas pratensis]|uniref:type II toxin-antitoxin system RelE/ParE family toxin n=1 Tax=Collimonas pratensis TaxID=279113 RepID=UPI00143D36FC|nr:type II toxin-antitoxin system RelE/ParE family toxin [Collimonas pratensis]NKI68846.1 addiction module toxin RelE [Collimonas pratensis]